MTARDWLAKRAELEAAATDGPWEAEATGGNIVTPTQGTIIEVFSWADADAEWIAETRTTAPAMRKALEAVLGIHHLIEGQPDCGDRCCGTTEDECAECCSYWPCDTVAAVTAALGVES